MRLIRTKDFIAIFWPILIVLVMQSAHAEDIRIMDVYADIDSADITLYSGEYQENITVDADLMHDGEVLRSRLLSFEELLPGIEVTRVIFWDIRNPRDGIYRMKVTLSEGNVVLRTYQYNFSYGIGWQPTPKLTIKDVVPDSRGVTVILTPFVPQFGTEQEPVITDVEYMLVDGNTVIYRTTDRRITVIQATSLSRDWNVRLENNHAYSTRVKVRISSLTGAVYAKSKDFISQDDARITELYRDGTGASATILGLSQVPFRGEIVFAVKTDGETIEERRERSPVLMSGDDETVEVTWSKRLVPGIYGLSVKAVGNDGDVVDTWDTIIEAGEQNRYGNESITPAETPGFTLSLVSVSSLALIFLFLQRKNRNR